jgi:hypothetical protein
MPYVCVNTSAELSDEKITELKAEIGKIIEIIPGKAEFGLMVDIESGKNLVFGGRLEDNVVVDTRVHGACTDEVKAAYTKALYEVVERVTGIIPPKVYTNFIVCDSWGAFGEIHF